MKDRDRIAALCKLAGDLLPVKPQHGDFFRQWVRIPPTYPMIHVIQDFKILHFGAG